VSFNGRRQRSDLVPNEPFRQRVLELTAQGVSKSEICKRLGWVRVQEFGDTNRLNRALGIAPNPHGNVQSTITLEMAARLAEVLEMDPHEVAL
jgi:hypothetical protein